jgi:transposase InsO family protein
MPTKLSTGKVRRVYEFIKESRDHYDTKMMCRVLGVTRSGYYAWPHEPISRRAQQDIRLHRLIRASFVASHGTYGAPRVFLDLREAGETCSKHRVARLMRVNKIRAVRGYWMRQRSVSKPSELVPNVLLRNFDVTRPNKAWVTDITHMARVALPCRCDGPFLPIDRWLGNEADSWARACPRRDHDGSAAAAAEANDHSLGPRLTVRKRRLAALLA